MNSKGKKLNVNLRPFPNTLQQFDFRWNLVKIMLGMIGAAPKFPWQHAGQPGYQKMYIEYCLAQDAFDKEYNSINHYIEQADKAISFLSKHKQCDPQAIAGTPVDETLSTTKMKRISRKAVSQMWEIHLS